MRPFVALAILCGLLTLVLSFVSMHKNRQATAVSAARDAQDMASILASLREDRVDDAVARLENHLDFSLALCEMNSDAQERVRGKLFEYLKAPRAYRHSYPISVDDETIRRSVQELLHDAPASQIPSNYGSRTPVR